MIFPMEINTFKILESKHTFLAHFFYLKRVFFLWVMQNCPNSRKNIWFHMFCQIFAEESEGGVWRVRNLVCREVRSCQENFLIYSIFVRPALYGAIFNISYQFFHQTNIWQGSTSHIQLVLNIIITSCLFLIELLLVTL